jgi:hypothetical protein
MRKSAYCHACMVTAALADIPDDGVSRREHIDTELPADLRLCEKVVQQLGEGSAVFWVPDIAVVPPAGLCPREFGMKPFSRESGRQKAILR